MDVLVVTGYVGHPADKPEAGAKHKDTARPMPEVWLALRSTTTAELGHGNQRRAALLAVSHRT